MAANNKNDSASKGSQILVEVSGFPVQITWKNVKRINLAVCPPHGEVRVSAPQHVDMASVYAFVEKNLDWILRQQAKHIATPLPSPKKFVPGEAHLVWGDDCSLEIHPYCRANLIIAENGTLQMHVRGTPERLKLAALLSAWRREQVRLQAEPIIERYRTAMQLAPVTLAVRQMKSRWGSCIPDKRRITLNSELAKTPPLCLEGVIIHELVHLLVPNHSEKFYAMMEAYFPAWREVKKLLSAQPPCPES